MKMTIAGIILTAYLIYDMHHGQDWSGGQGHTPRQFVADYLDLAYTQGRGVEAAQKYFAPTAVDHSPDSADRMDGPPIAHDVKQIIEDGLTVAVYHHVDAARGAPALEVVDIYKTRRGHILERTRISQPGAAPGRSSQVP
jgi:predicted SnoaL-like aldol condensation-catalyzing enzyme